MRMQRLVVWVLMGVLCAAPALADVLHTYEDLDEGFQGESLTLTGVTYRDVNNVSGFWPDGAPFGPDDVGRQLIVEKATAFYGDFPDYGSPVNSLTFGASYVPGDNLSIGALASVWMDLDVLSSAASFDLAFYENGPWGGIEYRLDAVLNGNVVASDSFVISDLGGRDNPQVTTLSVGGAFDSLHLYALKNGDFTVPRGMIDDLTVTAIPEPGAWVLLAGGLLARRR